MSPQRGVKARQPAPPASVAARSSTERGRCWAPWGLVLAWWGRGVCGCRTVELNWLPVFWEAVGQKMVRAADAFERCLGRSEGIGLAVARFGLGNQSTCRRACNGGPIGEQGEARYAAVRPMKGPYAFTRNLKRSRTYCYDLAYDAWRRLRARYSALLRHVFLREVPA